MTEYLAYSHTSRVANTEEVSKKPFREAFSETLNGHVAVGENERRRLDFLMEHGKSVHLIHLDELKTFALSHSIMYVVLSEQRAVEYRIRFNHRPRKL